MLKDRGIDGIKRDEINWHGLSQGWSQQNIWEWI